MTGLGQTDHAVAAVMAAAEEEGDVVAICAAVEEAAAARIQATFRGYLVSD